jgi:hypothetical protein
MIYLPKEVYLIVEKNRGKAESDVMETPGLVIVCSIPQGWKNGYSIGGLVTF